MSELLVIGFFGLALASCMSVLIAVGNLRSLRRLAGSGAREAFPGVSVLVPARNEERNIQACLDALVEQRYSNMEILVLDDHSEDHTTALVEAVTRRDRRVRLLHGGPVPQGWLGKHWACHQLVLAATGELVLFVDADTVVGADVVQDAVAAMCDQEADLLSLVPTRVGRSWPDRLVSAIVGWTILAWLPIGLAHSTRNPYLSAAFGPFMLFRRKAYERIGGHRAIRNNPLDDFVLSRRIKSAGLRWRLFDGSGRVLTDDYVTPSEAIDGLCRSVFPVFGFNVGAFLLVWAGLAALGLVPVAVIAGAALGFEVAPLILRLSGLTVLMLLASWGLASIRFGFSPLLAIFYPLPILLTLYIGLRSMLRTVLGRNTWKGRILTDLGPDPHPDPALHRQQDPAADSDDGAAPELERRDTGRL